ncbi:MAG: hypothetical protein K9N39_12000 [Candidatus Cloacimonetes bacterium]|nr:hypothetical protein [Candidatus Cloacimonadota bacterium]
MSQKTYQIILIIIMIVYSQMCFSSQTELDLNGCSLRQLHVDKTKSQLSADNLRNTWQGVGPWGGDVTSVAVDHQDPTILYAAVGNPYISTDSGATWQIWESLAAYSEVIYVITCTSDGIIYAGGDFNDDILKSTDGGTSWTQLSNFPISLREIRVISVDPADSDIIYVGVAGNSAATDWQQIAKTTNGGTSWTILDTNALGITMGVTDIAIDPGNTQNLVVSAEGGISGGDAVYSFDGGTSWFNIAGTLPTMYPFNDIEISGTDVYLGGGQLFGGQHVGVYKSQMGTFNWQNISTSFPLPVVNEVIVSPDNDQLIFAATEGDGIYISTDGGTTWEFG